MTSKNGVRLALTLATLAAASITACSGEDPNDASLDAGEADATEANSASILDGGTQDATTDARRRSGAVDAGVDEAAVGDAAERRDAADGGRDAIADAQPDVLYADPGAPCPTNQEVQTRMCGFCGTETRLCAPSGEGEAGPPVWQPWGACRNEVADAGSRCLPGQQRNNPCGLCGVQQQTCQSTCQWQSSACVQPTNAVCAPGSVQYVTGLSCADGGRLRTCGSACTYDGFSECTDPQSVFPGAVAISPSLGAKVTVGRNLAASRTQPLLSTTGTCPVGAPSASTLRSYDYVTLVNTDSTRSATVSVWTHGAPAPDGGITSINTIMAAYENRATPPQTTAERQACTRGVKDRCNATEAADPTACGGNWAGLFDESTAFGTDSRVKIGPGQQAVIYVSGSAVTDKGDYQLSIRTEALQ